MKHVVPERAESFPPNLSTEWNEFFSQGAYSLMLPIFIERSGVWFSTCFSFVEKFLFLRRIDTF